MVAHIVGEELQQESGHTATDTEEEVHTGEPRGLDWGSWSRPMGRQRV